MARTNVKLSEKAKKSACTRHNWGLQWCWNYERMQAAGYAWAMTPVIKELYDTEEAQCRELERHMQFYNTSPWTSALIMGADVALEESYEYEMGDNLKVALMGPLAGIGDTISATLLTPTFSILAASLASEGNWLSILVSLIPGLVTFIVRWPLFNYGYKQGINVINDVSGAGSLDTLQVAASVLGLTVIGGFVPSILSGLVIKSTFLATELTNDAGEVVSTTAGQIQAGLDAIFPYLIPIVSTALCYYLVKIKRVSPLKAILGVTVIAFVFGFFGVM